MTETNRPPTADKLTPAEQEALLCVVGHMIPPSEEFGLPAGDDPKIFADIVKSVGRDLPALQQALRMLAELAGSSLPALPAAKRLVLLENFRTRYPDLAGVLEAVTVRCYYRDDRVMASIGMEARPPFPIGFEVHQGDWTLLDPVRERGKIYRDVN